jgi:ketosteroid isomerase-like protein
VKPPKQELLKAAYAAFNRRDLDTALAVMHSEVEWANGLEGGTVRGPEALRAYWTRQWGLIDPHVEPLGFEAAGADGVVVKVHQVVRDLQGAVLADRVVCHVYAFEDDLVRRMEIREP